MVIIQIRSLIRSVLKDSFEARMIKSVKIAGDNNIGLINHILHLTRSDTLTSEISVILVYTHDFGEFRGLKFTNFVIEVV